MPEHEKRPWKLQAEQVKEDHLRKHPGYVYRPRRPEQKKGAAATATKANAKPAAKEPPPARRITVHENPVWSVSFPEDALEQPSGGKRGAPTDEPVAELRKRQRMSEPSNSAIPPPPPPPPRNTSSSNGGGITLPTVHMDNGAAPAKTRRTRSRPSVPIIAPARPAPPAQIAPAPQAQPEAGGIVEDLRRRHSVFTRTATPSSSASRPASGDVAEADTRPNSVASSSQPLHQPPSFMSLALSAGARGQPFAVPRLSRPLSQLTAPPSAPPSAPGTGHQSPPPPRLSTFGPPSFSPVTWGSTDKNTTPVRPPSPPVHPLQPAPPSSSSPKPSHAPPSSTSISRPSQPLMASLLPPAPSRVQPSPARTSSHSPASASESSQRTTSNSHSHTPTSSHSQPMRSRPRTQDDVMKDVLASASMKHQQRLQAIRVHWATSRRDEPYVQRLLGERIPEEFRQFHEHYLEHPTCYLPILKSGTFVFAFHHSPSGYSIKSGNYLHFV